MKRNSLAMGRARKPIGESGHSRFPVLRIHDGLLTRRGSSGILVERVESLPETISETRLIFRREGRLFAQRKVDRGDLRTLGDLAIYSGHGEGVRAHYVAVVLQIVFIEFCSGHFSLLLKLRWSNVD